MQQLWSTPQSLQPDLSTLLPCPRPHFQPHTSVATPLDPSIARLSSPAHAELSERAAFDPLWRGRGLPGERPHTRLARTYPTLATLAEVPPTRTSLFLLCDLREPAVVEPLQSQALLPAPSPASGWFPASGWAAAHESLAATLTALLPTFPAGATQPSASGLVAAWCRGVHALC